MKKVFTRSIAFVLLLAVLLSFAGCGASGKVKGVISDFQKACNDLDVNAALDCIDSAAVNIAKAASGIVGSLLGQNAEDLFDSLADLLPDNEDLSGTEFFKSLKIKVSKVTVNGDTAEAAAKITYIGISGAEVTRDGVFECHKVSDAWKITDFDFA